MTKITIADAVANLGIYEMEARALDALDGKQDGKITKDIFTQAKEELAKAKDMYAQENEDNILNISKFASVAKAMAYTITSKMGHVLFCESNKDLSKEEEEVLSKVSEIACNAIEYKEENGTLQGFTTDGLPNGVTNLKIYDENKYTDTSNDEIGFNENGEAIIVNKNPDERAVGYECNYGDTKMRIGVVGREDEW